MSLDPRSKVLSEDEETIEIVEVIENVESYSDLDDDDSYIVDYDEYL